MGAENEKVVVFYIELSEFVQWQCNEKGVGMVVSKVQKNDCGKALFVETGIESGWHVHSLNDKTLSDKKQKQIDKMLKRCDVESGFKVIFKRMEVGKDINTTKGLKPSVYRKSKRKT